MALYKFEKALQWLEDRGFPQVEGRSIKIFSAEIPDLRTSLKRGEIRFGSDGIYLKRNGREYRGYIYQPDYKVEEFGLSRFHLSKCKVITKFIDNNWIQRYAWSNAPTNDIQERFNPNQVYRDSTLPYCTKCRDVYSTPIATTEDFHALLKANKQDISATDILRSVPPNWKDITGRG